MHQTRERLSPARRGDRPCLTGRQPTNPFADRSGLYQEITDKIIAELEQGRLPWVQPWGGVRAPLALPKNASTGRAYSGITVTNDHARQEQVWKSLARAYNKDPYYIIRFDKGRKHLDAVAVGRAGLGLP